MFSRLLTLSSLSNKILRTGSTMLTRSQKLSVVESVLNVDHNELDNEFIVRLNSHSAVLEYERDGNIMKINYTEVPEIFGGKGVGSKLAKAALDYGAANNLRIQIYCDFVQNYYDKNPNKYKKFWMKT